MSSFAELLRLIRTVLRVLRITVLVVFVAPWVVLGLLGAMLNRIGALVTDFRILRLALESHLPCPHGHRSALHGVFECRGCGGLFAGWVFGSCPICGAHCGYTTCEHCGMAIRNPFV